jgi:hypothetical protein
LDREWDVERTLETNAATLVLLGIGLGGLSLVASFWLRVSQQDLLQHAVRGWCPPLPAFHHPRIRTAMETDNECLALKVLRGDFQDLRKERTGTQNSDVEPILKAVNR